MKNKKSYQEINIFLNDNNFFVYLINESKTKQKKKKADLSKHTKAKDAK
jgi:hypothetical protein